MNMKIILLVMTSLITTTASAALPNELYVKVGPDYFWATSNNYFIERINPIEGSLQPAIMTGTLRGGNLAGNVGLGWTFPTASAWQFSPEFSYIQPESYWKKFTPLMVGPEEGTDLINTFNSKMRVSIFAAILNIEYKLHQHYSVYVAPGVGVANIRTRGQLNYQAAEAPTNTLLGAKVRQNNFSPQMSVSVKYPLLSKLFLDFSLSVIRVGNLSFGKFSNDPDFYTATKIAANNAYLFGPKLNLTYYFG